MINPSTLLVIPAGIFLFSLTMYIIDRPLGKFGFLISAIAIAAVAIFIITYPPVYQLGCVCNNGECVNGFTILNNGDIYVKLQPDTEYMINLSQTTRYSSTVAEIEGGSYTGTDKFGNKVYTDPTHRTVIGASDRFKDLNMTFEVGRIDEPYLFISHSHNTLDSGYPVNPNYYLSVVELNATCNCDCNPVVPEEVY